MTGAAARARRAGTALLLLMLAALASGCAWWDTKQRQIALRPTPGRPAQAPVDEQAFRAGDERFVLQVAAEPASGTAAGGSGATHRLALWWLPHADRGAPTLLYLHGTFRNLWGNLPKIDALRAAGFSVLAVDYRGWGDSEPIVPSEATIAADAAAAWAELVRREPRAGLRVIYGHSMGGAVAVRLASTLRGMVAGDARDYGAVVLESTFTRMPDIAREAGWLARTLSDWVSLDFDSSSRIARVDGPVWILHGSADTTVPVVLGRRLRDEVRPGVLARWVEVPGGTHSWLHRDAPDTYRRTFGELIRSLTPPPPPPPPAPARRQETMPR